MRGDTRFAELAIEIIANAIIALKARDERMVARALEITGLAPLVRRPVAVLSGGPVCSARRRLRLPRSSRVPMAAKALGKSKRPLWRPRPLTRLPPRRLRKPMSLPTGRMMRRAPYDATKKKRIRP